jgi:hypothetical protein
MRFNQKKQKKIGFVALGVCALLMLNGCFYVKVKKGVGNPGKYFRRAHAQLERIHRSDPDRRGKVSRIHVLIYTRSSRELVTIEAPVWIVDQGLEIGSELSDYEEDIDFNQRYDFDWEGISGLCDIGPGLLVEVEDEKSRLLVWLE